MISFIAVVLIILFMFVTYCIIFVCVNTILQKRTRSMYKQFMTRKECFDNLFIHACNLGTLSCSEQLFVIKLRHCIAKLARVPETSIYATDIFNDTILLLPFWNNFDGGIFVTELMKDTGITFNQKQINSITSPDDELPHYSVREFVFEWLQLLRSSNKIK